MLPKEQPVIIHPTPTAQHYIYEYASGRRMLVAVESVSGRLLPLCEL